MQTAPTKKPTLCKTNGYGRSGRRKTATAVGVLPGRRWCSTAGTAAGATAAARATAGTAARATAGTAARAGAAAGTRTGTRARAAVLRVSSLENGCWHVLVDVGRAEREPVRKAEH